MTVVCAHIIYSFFWKDHCFDLLQCQCMHHKKNVFWVYNTWCHFAVKVGVGKSYCWNKCMKYFIDWRSIERFDLFCMDELLLASFPSIPEQQVVTESGSLHHQTHAHVSDHHPVDQMLWTQSDLLTIFCTLFS